MTDQPPEHDPIQKFYRCDDGNRMWRLWIRAFLDGYPDTKYLWDQYKAHLDGCDTCRKADNPR